MPALARRSTARCGSGRAAVTWLRRWPPRWSALRLPVVAHRPRVVGQVGDRLVERALPPRCAARRRHRIDQRLPRPRHPRPDPRCAAVGGVVAGRGLLAAIGWVSKGWRLGVLCGLASSGIAAMNNWDLAMDTLSQVLVAVVISVCLAVPIGIWAGRSRLAREAVLRPFLDTAQVMPQFVYLVPVVFLFNVGPHARGDRRRDLRPPARDPPRQPRPQGGADRTARGGDLVRRDTSPGTVEGAAAAGRSSRSCSASTR